jgi:hypothetical protein
MTRNIFCDSLSETQISKIKRHTTQMHDRLSMNISTDLDWHRFNFSLLVKHVQEFDIGQMQHPCAEHVAYL